MKKILLTTLTVCLSLYAAAQTYNGGVWYSLYDASSHELNTISNYSTGDVFAPTANSLQFTWKYTKVDLMGWFSSNTTKIYESANGGSNTTQVGTLSDKTWNTEHSENISISTNINWLKWDRATGNTHKVTLSNIKVPLAKHILLESGTYGTTSATKSFGEVVAQTTSDAMQIKLRSFLTAGDITITCSNPEIFHLGSPDNTDALTYAVGANACASAKGTAATAGGGTLGKIDNYAFNVYFTPQVVADYSATITLTDGTSTATVTINGTGKHIPTEVTVAPVASDIVEGNPLSESVLTGGEASVPGTFAWQTPEAVPAVGTQTYTVVFTPENAELYASSTVDVTVNVLEQKFEQTITWEDVLGEIYATHTLPLTATASSGLAVTYSSSDTTVAIIDETNTLIALAEGTAVITVTQAGNASFEPAEAIQQTITVLPLPTFYGAYEAAICEGDSIEFAGLWYSVATEQAVLLEQKNSVGGDSIVNLTVEIHPVYRVADTLSVHHGMYDTWQEIAIGQLPEGDTTLVVNYTSMEGCDSTHVLHLSVLPMIVTTGDDTLYVCSGETVTYEGKTYKRSTKDSVLVSEKNIYGGDSIVALVVKGLPAMRLTLERTITVGEEAEWQDYDLSTIGLGDTTLVAAYTSVNGCDSTYTLYLTVVEQVATSVQTLQSDNEAHKMIIDGQMYIRKGEAWYDALGRKVNAIKKD